jgi:hypothetical protein
VSKEYRKAGRGEGEKYRKLGIVRSEKKGDLCEWIKDLSLYTSYHRQKDEGGPVKVCPC